MKTGEYNSAMGGLKKMTAKTPATKYRAADFTFLVGGFTKMLSNDARQKLFGENLSYSFHASAFMRHDHLVDTYISTVKLALADMGRDYLSDFNSIMKLAPYQKEGKSGKSFAELMSEFWQKTYDKGLHSRLQGHNNWLFETAKNNDTVRAYITQLDSFHSMNLNAENAPSIEGSSDNSWYGQHGYGESMIFGYNAKTNTRSLQRMLKKLDYEGGEF